MDLLTCERCYCYEFICSGCMTQHRIHYTRINSQDSLYWFPRVLLQIVIAGFSKQIQPAEVGSWN